MKKIITLFLLFILIMTACENPAKDDSTPPVTYSITFDANGGSGTMPDQDIEEGASANLAANAFSCSGYSFTGWSTTAAGTVAYADGDAYVMDTGADVVLYAVWESVFAGKWFNSEYDDRSGMPCAMLDISSDGLTWTGYETVIDEDVFGEAVVTFEGAYDGMDDSFRFADTYYRVLSLDGDTLTYTLDDTSYAEAYDGQGLTYTYHRLTEENPEIYGAWDVNGVTFVFSRTTGTLNDFNCSIIFTDNIQNKLICSFEQEGETAYCKFEWNDSLTQMGRCFETDKSTCWNSVIDDEDIHTGIELINADPNAPNQIFFTGSLKTGDIGVDVGLLTAVDLQQDEAMTFSVQNDDRFQVDGNGTLHFSGTADYANDDKYDLVVRVTDSTGLYTDFEVPVYIIDDSGPDNLEINGTWDCSYGSSTEGTLEITNSDVGFSIPDQVDFGGFILEYDNAANEGLIVWTYHPSRKYIHCYSLFRWVDNGDGTVSFDHQRLDSYDSRSEAVAAGFDETGDTNYNDWILTP